MKLKQNLHHVFLVIGILYGFYMFAASLANIDNTTEAFAVGIMAYLFIYLPAFFGGLYSGIKRADNSDLLDEVVTFTGNLFDVDLINHNHILARLITGFYFAFWIILGIMTEGPVFSFIIWVTPAYIFGFFANKDGLSTILSKLVKFIDFLCHI